MVYTGAGSYLAWDRETSGFNSGIGTIDSAPRIWGLEQKIDSWSLTNSPIPIMELNSLLPNTFAYGASRGSIGLSWVLSNPLFLDCIFDTRSSAGAGPYTHTWSNVTKQFASFAMAVGSETGATDKVRHVKGCVLGGVRLSANIGDVVRASADLSYASESYTSTLDATPAAEDAGFNFPYTFASACIQVPDATALSEVQSMDLSINTNSDLLYALCSNIAVGAFKRQLDITGTFRLSYNNAVAANDFLARVYNQIGRDATGASVTPVREQPSITITFDNGQAGTSSRKIEFKFANLSFGSFDMSVQPNEPIFVDLPWQARTVTSVIATDNQATFNTTFPGLLSTQT